MVTMSELLKNRLGNEFPVGTGSATREDPLLISEQRDYVSVEYTAAKFLLSEMGLEYKLEKQSVLNLDGRVIDELVFAAREPAEPEWTKRRNFYFDITSGYRKTYASHPYDGFELATSTTGVVFANPSSEVLRDELLGFAQQNFRDGTTPKSHLYALKGDGSRFIFQIGKLELTTAERDDFVRYLLFVERAAAYALSFRVGVDLGGGIGVVERLAVFSADRSSYAAGELTLNSKDKGGRVTNCWRQLRHHPSMSSKKCSMEHLYGRNGLYCSVSWVREIRMTASGKMHGIDSAQRSIGFEHDSPISSYHPTSE